MAVKEFITAAKEASEEDESILEFTVDGVECRAYPPKDGQLAVLMATTASHSSENEQIAGIINFFVAVLDDDTHTFLVSKLLDRKDPFGIEQVQDIMSWMVEEWTARPTKSPSGSTPSRSSGGRKSTRAIPA